MNTAIASRYAKALLKMSEELGAMDTVYADMQRISEGCKKLRDLQLLLKSPLVKTDKKIHVLHQIFASSISEVTDKFVILMTKNRRESYLGEIAESYITQYKEKKNIVTAEVISAVPLKDEARAKIRLVLQKWYKAEIEIVEIVKPELVGGFIINVGNKQVDMSVLRRLNQLKKYLNESHNLN
jgi:F-type H+-transporting ATPase subunit delta